MHISFPLCTVVLIYMCVCMYICHKIVRKSNNVWSSWQLTLCSVHFLCMYVPLSIIYDQHLFLKLSSTVTWGKAWHCCVVSMTSNSWHFGKCHSGGTTFDCLYLLYFWIHFLHFCFYIWLIFLHLILSHSEWLLV